MVTLKIKIKIKSKSKITKRSPEKKKIERKKTLDSQASQGIIKLVDTLTNQANTFCLLVL